MVKLITWDIWAAAALALAVALGGVKRTRPRLRQT